MSRKRRRSFIVLEPQVVKYLCCQYRWSGKKLDWMDSSDNFCIFLHCYLKLDHANFENYMSYIIDLYICRLRDTNKNAN